MMDPQWRGWTAHEFRLMLLKEPEPFKKIQCECCGRAYVYPTEWPHLVCARCLEIES